MVKNLLIIVSVIFLFPGVSLADEEETKGKSIEEVKTHIINNNG